MLEWVHRRAVASGAQRVLIAAGDEAVFECAQKFGAEVQITRSDHPSGTARLAEVVASRQWEPDTIVVNVQGDEPMIAPESVAQVAKNLYECADAFAATLCAPLLEGEFEMPDVVKVWANDSGFAQGFARQPQQEVDQAVCDRHLGIYAYRAQGLLDYASLDEAPTERAESLEQLRLLHHQLPIHVARIAGHELTSIGVDTPEDLERVRELMEAEQ